MEAKVDEIGDRIFRISTFMPHVLPPAGLTFNQFLILADEPMLFHCGHRKQFSNVSAAVAKVLPLDKLRWVSFGHFEADECGAMNEWLAVSAARGGRSWRRWLPCLNRRHGRPGATRAFR